MKRVGYAGLFFLAGLVFPVLIWVAAVVAVRKILIARRELRSTVRAISNVELDYASDDIAVRGKWVPGA